MKRPLRKILAIIIAIQMALAPGTGLLPAQAAPGVSSTEPDTPIGTTSVQPMLPPKFLNLRAMAAPTVRTDGTYVTHFTTDTTYTVTNAGLYQIYAYGDGGNGLNAPSCDKNKHGNGGKGGRGGVSVHQVFLNVGASITILKTAGVVTNVTGPGFAMTAYAGENAKGTKLIADAYFTDDVARSICGNGGTSSGGNAYNDTVSYNAYDEAGMNWIAGVICTAVPKYSELPTLRHDGHGTVRDYTGTLNMGKGGGGGIGWQNTTTIECDGAYGENGTAGGMVIEIMPDTTPPIISGVNVSTAWGATNTATITATDDMSGVKDYAVTTTNSAPSSSWQTSNTFTLSANGTYYAWVRDNTGWVSVGKSFIVNKIDVTAPTITGATVTPTGWFGSNKTITVTASDSQSGVAKYGITTNTTAPTTWQDSNVFIKPNGVYYLWCKDNVGLVSQHYKVEVSQVDTDKPVISSVTLPTVWIQGNNATAVVASDTGSGIVGYALTTTNAAPSTGWQSNPNFIITANGIYYYWAKDTVNLVSDGYRVEVTQIPYNVTIIPSEHGTIQADKNVAVAGDTVTLTVTPDRGYKLVDGSLKVNGTALVGDSFTMLPEDVEITAAFEAIIYKVETVQPPHGKLTADKTTAIIGDTVTVTVTPDIGYRLVEGSLKENGRPITAASFTMQPEDIEITAAFEAIIYKVETVQPEHGKLTANKTTAIIGDTVTVTVTPEIGYRLVEGSLKANDINIMDGSFTMTAEDVEITAAFEAIIYTVTVAAMPHGVVTVDKETATIGEQIKITVTPDPGYKLVEGSIKVNGSTSGEVFTMGAENVMVMALFEPIIYTVKLEQSPHGTITADKTNAVIGDKVTVTVLPDKGYRLKPGSLKADGKPVVGNSFIVAARTPVVTVEFEAIPYTVTIDKMQNGTVTADKDIAIIGETVQLTITPDIGYRLVDGSIKSNGNTIGESFTMEAENAVISAEFEPVIYDLFIQQTPGGTITADKATAVMGDTVTLTVTPDRGYRITIGSLKVNGANITGNSFVMQAESARIRAEFEPITVSGSVRDTKGNGLPGMMVHLSGSAELVTASYRNGIFSFATVPNGSYTLTATHYKWDTATASLEIQNGYILEPEKLKLVCTRDDRLEVLEALIRSLPEPLEDGSHDIQIKDSSTDIRRAKTLYDELPEKMKPQLDKQLKDKLEKLLIRLAVIESQVNSNLVGVKADGLEQVVDKSKFVSVDGELTSKITVVLQIETTNNPAVLDKEAIDALKDKEKSIGTYMDINLLLQVDSKEPTQITETQEPITLQLPVPRGMEGGGNYRIVRVHNGVAEYLDTTVGEDNMVTFATNKFSTYAIEYIPRYISDDDDNSDDEKTVPIPKVEPIATPPTPPIIIKPTVPTLATPKQEEEIRMYPIPPLPPTNEIYPIQSAQLPTIWAYVVMIGLSIIILLIVFTLLLIYLMPIIKARGERRAEKWLEKDKGTKEIFPVKCVEQQVQPVVVSKKEPRTKFKNYKERAEERTTELVNSNDIDSEPITIDNDVFVTDNIGTDEIFFQKMSVPPQVAEKKKKGSLFSAFKKKKAPIVNSDNIISVFKTYGERYEKQEPIPTDALNIFTSYPLAYNTYKNGNLS